MDIRFLIVGAPF